MIIIFVSRGVSEPNICHTYQTGPFGIDVDRARGIALLREAFELGKELQVFFTEGEGVVVEGVSIGPPYLTMKFSDEEGYRWCSLDWRDEE